MTNSKTSTRKPTRKFVVHDRYTATGIPHPGKHACKRCDGMGFHPLKCDCRGKLKHHRRQKELRGWCWVSPCQSCEGTRVQLYRTNGPSS